LDHDRINLVKSSGGNSMGFDAEIDEGEHERRKITGEVNLFPTECIFVHPKNLVINRIFEETELVSSNQNTEGLRIGGQWTNRNYCHIKKIGWSLFRRIPIPIFRS
jgi:hypothetical protein